MAGDPGWRDPRLSLLRTAGFIVIAALLVWVIVVEEDINLGAMGSLLGALLVLLGFSVLVKWPPQ